MKHDKVSVHVEDVKYGMWTPPRDDLPGGISNISSQVEKSSECGVAKCPDGNPCVKWKEWNVHALSHLVNDSAHD